jgi:hypothetical protein
MRNDTLRLEGAQALGLAEFGRGDRPIAPCAATTTIE